MGELFGRAWSLTIAAKGQPFGLDVSDLDFEFKCVKSLKHEPNTCDVRVWDLSPDNRASLETPKVLILRLEAGYKDQLTQLFLGEVRSAQSIVDGPHVITEFASGDSEKEIATARLNVSMGPKTPPDAALEAIVSALGIGRGNLDAAKALLLTKGVASIHARGLVLTGNAARKMNDFCRSAGLEWSIQDGTLQILDIGKPLETVSAIQLSASTGLVGSPTVDSKGIATATCLLIPDLRPGVKVAFGTKNLRGGYRVTHCEYTGSTFATDWYCKITAEKY